MKIYKIIDENYQTKFEKAINYAVEDGYELELDSIKLYQRKDSSYSENRYFAIMGKEATNEN